MTSYSVLNSNPNVITMFAVYRDADGNPCGTQEVRILGRIYYWC